MVLVFASEFGTRLDFLEQRKTELYRLLNNEFHPKRIQGLLDQIKNVNIQIKKENRFKYTSKIP